VARHGPGHTISPSAIPARANIAGLKSLGVRAIIAFSAVGSLREEITPGSFVIPSQIIDRTKGIRPASFFEGTSVVAHAMFGDPFSGKLVSWLAKEVSKALEKEGRGVQVFTDKTIVCMEGPQFSTRAESLMYRQWGGDLINMSVLPEAKLAREAEMRCGYLVSSIRYFTLILNPSYALIATATDYDSWRPHSEAVTVAEVFNTLRTNAETARIVAATILDDLHNAMTGDGSDIFLEEIGKMKYSIMPQSTMQKAEDRAIMAYILPEYFSGENEKDAKSG